MPTNPLKTIKESIENLRENIWTFDKKVERRICHYEINFFILPRQEDSDLYRSGMNCRQPVGLTVP